MEVVEVASPRGAEAGADEEDDVETGGRDDAALMVPVRWIGARVREECRGAREDHSPLHSMRRFPHPCRR
jgi:hypothetical protein